MTALLCTLLALPCTTDQAGAAVQHVKVGHSAFYGAGLIERVAARRGLRLPKGYAGFAAVQECDWQGRKDAFMGRTVWANINRTGWRAYLVADCSHPRDRARHRRIGLVIEVSYANAKAQGWSRQGRARAAVVGYE